MGLTSTQQRTVAWAQENEKTHDGGIIAHKPGCGKTLIAITLSQRDNGAYGRKELYVVPPTLAVQWQAEIAKFSDLNAVLYVKQNEVYLDELVLDPHVQVIIVSYYTLLHARSTSMLYNTKWHRIIADEAHQIRNPDTAISKCMQQLEDQSTCKLIDKKGKRHDGAVLSRVGVGAEKLEHFCVMPASNVDGTSGIPTAPHKSISIPCRIVHAPRRPLCLCRPHDSI
ncbi:MAG: hypothetical protein EOO38_21540, partial [Cytophagaceae bacterium]